MDEEYRINTYFLFSISHPNHNGCPTHDLSKEIPLNSSSMSKKQLLLERVLHKVFLEYNIPLDLLNKRIRTGVKAKLWRMGKVLSQKGGKNRKNQLTKWKDEEWIIRPELKRAHSVLRQVHQNLKKNFKEQVNKLQSTIEKEKEKSANLASTIEKEKGISAHLSTQLTTFKSLTANAIRSINEDCTISANYKKWSEYSRQHKSFRRTKYAEEVKGALTLCTSSSIFEPTMLHLRNKETSEKLEIDMSTGKCKEHKPKEVENKLAATLYIKEKFAISDRAYQELSSLTEELPRAHKLKEMSRDYDSESEILSTPNGITGVQQSLESRLKIRLAKLAKAGMPNKLRVKLSGDGTSVARSMHLINFTFTILEEKDINTTPSGNHTLAIIKAPETYNDLQLGLSDIANEVKRLKTIQLDTTLPIIPIEYFLTGDWKFLALATGVEAANARFSCVWCKCPKEDRYNMDLDWSMLDNSKGGRTTEAVLYSTKKKHQKKWGYSEKPIFQSIPLIRVVIDPLHLFLRIADVLINLTIAELRRLDGLDKSKENNLRLRKYEEFLNTQCKVAFHWISSKTSKELEAPRDLTGPEKVRLFSTINIPELFPDFPNKDEVQKLWKDFFHLSNKITETGTDPQTFQNAAQAWVRNFLLLYQTKHVTPYIHAFAMHVAEFMNLYGSLEPFSQQALEKLNDMTTFHYLRSTNHHHQQEEALRQLILKRNRLEKLEDNDAKREKRAFTCGKCGGKGHNKRACPNNH